MTLSTERTGALARPASALLAGCLALGACDPGRGELPDEVEVTNVIASSSSGFIMEGCASVIYRLHPATANKVTKQGLAFFERVESLRKSDRYSDWKETPILGAEAKHILALRAIRGCEKTEEEPSARAIREALQTRGSFYAITDNREGMIFVAPRANLAAFFYLG